MDERKELLAFKVIYQSQQVSLLKAFKRGERDNVVLSLKRLQTASSFCLLRANVEKDGHETGRPRQVGARRLVEDDSENASVLCLVGTYN